jgi:aminomethyltransferase
MEILQPLIDADLRSMRYYRGGLVQILHPAARRQGGVISRTGYTGEDGFELSVGSDIALGVWQAILHLGRPLGLVPTGLGARDTLRLEAGMPLYSHELSEQIDPFTAGLGFACHLAGYDFPGRDALRRIEKGPPGLMRVGLELSGPRVAREGFPLLKDGQAVGRVTSGTFSPSLQKPIAMGYVPRALAAAGTTLSVDIRGHQEEARVVAMPFFHRDNQGVKK